MRAIIPKRGASPSRQRGYIGVRRALYSSGNPLATTPISQIIASASFNVALSDAGAGAVSTTAYKGSAATFVRATTAWTKLSTGLWTQVASGQARAMYSGFGTTAVGTYSGYFQEGAGIQLVTPTASIRDMTDASWVAVTMTVAKTGTGIDGVGNSCTRLTAAAGNATILQTLVAAATTRTYSCWILRVTGVGEIDISEDGTSWTDITSQINSSTFTRVSITVSQLNAAFGIRVVTSGDVILVDFNQFEAGNFATSPMDSAGANRNSDVLTYVSAGSMSATNGTAYAELSLEGISTGAIQYAVSTTTVLGPLNIASAAAATSIQASDGTNNIAAAGLTDMSTGVRKRAASWANVTLNVAGDGAAVTAGAFDGDIGSTAIGIGCATDGTLNWYGTVKNVRIWKQAFFNQSLQALTS